MADPDTLHHSRYSRSNSYDPEWVAHNQMGPNALWLTADQGTSLGFARVVATRL